ncbi:hypothetical protein bcCo53_001538 (plasmid) [Borrelia coriaceae]|uniref:Uncharacterized protein n=1 Tax=Borrelia coriaceae ATCC 43381 TaxID=1408429 RepID=W5SWP5_9SPIR|nr:plasmid maintenance protein [Borrelia coriaceae]AHH11340.1 Hypothetical protein BCO_0129700 [Borrelia coriaceae ATCC 43381]UPA17351.1 hypothetical protein bcCo53_001538 [Borrelia coriaceae]
MKDTEKNNNKHQHKLIILISTLNYMNLKLKKYTQSDILYYFNKNIKQNKYKSAKIKTLQNYLYKLNKIFGVTLNYYRHLGVNMGTEIHYSLKYSKKECYRIINKHFINKKEERHQNRVNAYLEKTCTKNSNVKKEECYYNTYNREKKNNTKCIEKIQVHKYATKCKFKTNTFFSILNLELKKNDTIEILKALKRTENFFQNGVYKKESAIKPKEIKLKNKQLELTKILNEMKIGLKNEGYNSEQLNTQIQNVYEYYKYKPHFIIESNKYNDLKKIIKKLKKTIGHVKITTKETEEMKNNIFSILLDQFKHKVDVSILAPILKSYLNKQDKLEYGKVFSNHYYYAILSIINNNKSCLKAEKFERIIS